MDWGWWNMSAEQVPANHSWHTVAEETAGRYCKPCWTDFFTAPPAYEEIPGDPSTLRFEEPDGVMLAGMSFPLEGCTCFGTFPIPEFIWAHSAGFLEGDFSCGSALGDQLAMIKTQAFMQDMSRFMGHSAFYEQWIAGYPGQYIFAEAYVTSRGHETFDRVAMHVVEVVFA